MEVMKCYEPEQKYESRENNFVINLANICVYSEVNV
jgi:hypothetical protein